MCQNCYSLSQYRASLGGFDFPPHLVNQLPYRGKLDAVIPAQMFLLQETEERLNLLDLSSDR